MKKALSKKILEVSNTVKELWLQAKTLPRIMI